MDKRTDDFIGEVEVRSDDNQEIKSFELFAHEFRVNDATGEVDFLDEATRDRLLDNVAAAVLLVVRHELEPPPEAASTSHPSKPGYG